MALLLLWDRFSGGRSGHHRSLRRRGIYPGADHFPALPPVATCQRARRWGPQLREALTGTAGADLHGRLAKWCRSECHGQPPPALRVICLESSDQLQFAVDCATHVFSENDVTTSMRTTGPHDMYTPRSVFYTPFTACIILGGHLVINYIYQLVQAHTAHNIAQISDGLVRRRPHLQSSSHILLWCRFAKARAMQACQGRGQTSIRATTPKLTTVTTVPAGVFSTSWPSSRTVRCQLPKLAACRRRHRQPWPSKRRSTRARLWTAAGSCACSARTSAAATCSTIG
jgi:hypothetical protein